MNRSDSNNFSVQNGVLMTADDALFYSFFIIGPLGLFFNTVLLVITFRKKSIREQEYTIFIQNRGFMDTFLCLQFFILQPWASELWNTNPTWCKMAGGLFLATFYALIASEAVLAVNRYIAICRRQMYQKVYQKRYISLMCSSTWFIGVIAGLADFLAVTTGKSSGLLCCAKLEWSLGMFVYLGVNAPVVCASYLIMFYCYWKIYRFLKAHQAASLTTDERTRLQEDKSVLRYIGWIGLLPVISELPVISTDIIHLFNPTMVPDFATFATTIILMLCPVLNPVLTVYIIRPIRKELWDSVKNLVKAFTTKTFVVQLAK